MSIGSVHHTTVILNGTQIRGLAPDADSIMYPSRELLAVEEGADGFTAFYGLGVRGGQFQIKVQATSASLPFLATEFEISRVSNGAGTIFNGSTYNSLTGERVTMRGGRMFSGPFGQTHGQGAWPANIYIFHFAELSRDLSASKLSNQIFVPSPVAA